MKKTKKETVPATTRDVIVSTVCDFCGEKIETIDYDVNEVLIQHKKGESYPDCGAITQTSVDMCGMCFDEKLMPWLKSQGVKAQEEIWDW